MRNTFSAGFVGLILLCSFGFSLGPTSPTYGAELADVSLPDQIEIGEHTLLLNGMGLRKKAIIKVYVAGLYVSERSSDPAAILAADAPRRMVMNFRFGVSAKKMCSAWDDGLENNTPSAGAEVEGAFETLCSYMDDMEKGDRMVFTYLPGDGTQVEVKGADRGVLAGGKATADAVFASWIGPNPPSDDFKAGLLGN